MQIGGVRRKVIPSDGGGNEIDPDSTAATARQLTELHPRAFCRIGEPGRPRPRPARKARVRGRPPAPCEMSWLLS